MTIDQICEMLLRTRNGYQEFLNEHSELGEVHYKRKYVYIPEECFLTLSLEDLEKIKMDLVQIEQYLEVLLAIPIGTHQVLRIDPVSGDIVQRYNTKSLAALDMGRNIRTIERALQFPKQLVRGYHFRWEENTNVVRSKINKSRKHVQSIAV